MTVSYKATNTIKTTSTTKTSNTSKTTNTTKLQILQKLWILLKRQILLKVVKFGLGNQELGLENQELKHGEISYKKIQNGRNRRLWKTIPRTASEA